MKHVIYVSVGIALLQNLFFPLSLSSNKCLFQSIQYQWFAKSKLGKLLLNITKINCLQCSYYIFIRIVEYTV